MERYENFPSAFVDSRHIEIWLPPGGEKSRSRKYPVVYMHDGQYLFRTAWDSWGLQEKMDRLVREDKISPAVIVGIWNTGKRWQEYAPERPVREIVSSEKQAAMHETGYYPTSDNYLKFMVHELKPFIDRTFPVKTEPQYTFTMGSSLGGVISTYAACEYPEVFGGAAGMSTHWPVVGGVMVPYLEQALPDPDTHKFYFDYSTLSFDVQYESFQNEIDQLMRSFGYIHGENWITDKIIDVGHDAISWGKRADGPLSFLLAAV